MTTTTRTLVVAAVLGLAVFAGATLETAATTTTTEQMNEQTNESASVAFPDQRIDGRSVTIDAATLPDGGFAVVYDQGGTPIGHTDYLSAGDHENLTVSLNESVEEPQVLVVSLYRNNGSESYDAATDSVAYQTDTGADVSDVAFVYFEERGRSTTDETSTAASDGTTAEETTATSDEVTTTATTQTASGDTPGFTPITAVVALLAAALVALRRN